MFFQWLVEREPKRAPRYIIRLGRKEGHFAVCKHALEKDQAKVAAAFLEWLKE